MEETTERSGLHHAMVIDAASGLEIKRRRFPWPHAVMVHTGQVTIAPVAFSCPDRLLIYVHGYNEDIGNAKAYGQGSIAEGHVESGGQCAVATFVWNSKFGIFGFGRALRAANATAPAFARAIEQLRAVCPAMRIHVLAHSLGARVVLRALAENQITLGDVALVAPAIDADALGAGGEFAAAVGRVERLLVTHNQWDRSLRWYRTRGRRALGERGFPSSLKIPAHVLVEDMGQGWRNHARDGGHGAILHPLFWGEFWRRAAARKFFQ